MRKLLMGLAWILVTLPAAHAQVVTSDLPVFTDRVEVNLVTLRVIVTTALDRPVTDLNREDFEIWEDSEHREITHFERVTDGSIDDVGDGSFRETSHISPPSSDLRRLVVLAFDSSSVADLPYQRRAVVAARDFVAAHNDSGIHWSVALVGGDPRCLVPPTTDAESVVEGLDSLRRLFKGVAAHRTELPVSFRVPSETPRLAGSWCRLTMTEQALFMPETTRALTNLFRAYGAIPGAKACVFFHPGPTGATFAGCGGLNSLDMMRHQKTVDLWQTVARHASTAGFKVYGMSSQSLRAPMANADSHSFTTLANRSLFNFSTNDAAGIMAARTGGDTYVSNNLDMVIENAMRETGSYYSLSFVAPRTHDGKMHDIDVKVRGQGPLKVRHKKGVYDFDPRVLLVEQLGTPPEFPKIGGDFPVDLVLQTEEVSDDRIDITITASIEYSDLSTIPVDGGLATDIDVFLAVHDEEGQLLGITQNHHRIAFSDEISTEKKMTVPLRLLLPADNHNVSVGVYDTVSGLSGMGTAIAFRHP